MKVLIFDNYDSFTYNLAHMIEEITGDLPDIVKNDQCTLDEVAAASHIVLSPGPGVPDEAGLLKHVIETLGPTHKMLGVCLGFQAIGEVYGGSLYNLDKVFHGIQSDIHVVDKSDPIVGSLDSPFQAGRYHSWVIDRDLFPDCLSISAVDGEGNVMAGRHREFAVYGVQFHPESIMTPEGERMMRNFLQL